MFRVIDPANLVAMGRWDWECSLRANKALFCLFSSFSDEHESIPAGERGTKELARSSLLGGRVNDLQDIDWSLSRLSSPLTFHRSRTLAKSHLRSRFRGVFPSESPKCFFFRRIFFF
ncbi:hypothetical protein TNIN_166281 [Trichonephila inaurata madagascariensis]|uniref:Uncharacterized protein n=1 Tax=Trichonephila inaurata madagascariensis TaxID=2747483 RepID=A0A8X6Y3F5_9ARAC|nr:hypothetical protein TNIN_166281 [Trichonephila inaurata madagascariensis]